MDYNFNAIEAKWKQQWAADQLYTVSHESDRPKYYVLDMFPYPSGAGLHVGHPLGYIASDIISRYKRQKGFNVLHPMGYDAFGLPAEQYAIETGQHPAQSTAKNIKTFRAQLDNIGFCYDWSRQVMTSDPNYYKWTQWIFLQIFGSWYDNAAQKARPIEELEAIFAREGNTNIDAAGDETESFTADTWNAMTAKQQSDVLINYRLAYLADATVNWCEALGTVLANDEVKDGLSERGGHPVERVQMQQWFLRITAFAERLLVGLDQVDWSDALKEMQRNWIGKSEGASVRFAIENSERQLEIFTTRPDTIFGASFMVLAPEHEYLDEITTAEQQQEIADYVKYVKSRSDIERQQEKKVTGAFTGSYAIHPFTGKQVPIYIAEYVLAGYGTGAIMAVPSDDERDAAFAQKFGLDIVEVVDKPEGASASDKVGTLINSDFLNGMTVKKAIKRAIHEIESKGIGSKQTNYKLRDAGFSRQRYWGEPFPIVYDNGVPRAVAQKELPVELPMTDNFAPGGLGETPLSRITEWVDLGNGQKREVFTMPGNAGSSWYFLRYMDPNNGERFVGEQAEQYWQDVDLYIGGTEHAVGHLLYARFWQNVLFDLGHVSKEEPFKKLINQGMIQGRSSLVYRVEGSNQFVSHGLRQKYDTTTIRVDIKLVKNDELDIEAFKQWRSEFADAEFVLEDGVYKCGYEIEKMSKRWHNVVNPDDLIADYGADCFRMYEMFLGPVEHHKPWNTDGIDGVSKFLRKWWRTIVDENGQLKLIDATPEKAELKVLHRTIKKLGDDIERFSLNTCVSTFMIALNELSALKCDKLAVYEPLVRAMAPFAPFLSEELYAIMGGQGSVHKSDFPTYEEQYLKDDEIMYPVSVNGKKRAEITLPAELLQDDAQSQVMELPELQKWLAEGELKRFIFVKGRMINLVIK